MGALSNKASFNSAIRYLISYIQGTMNCVMPAQIVDYNRKKHTASVQPLIKTKYEESEGSYSYKTKPIIKSVSVFHISHGGFDIDIPLKKGDTGWLIASDRDGTIAKQRNGKTNPSNNEGPQEQVTNEMHSFSSGFFIPDSWCEDGIDGEDLVISAKTADGKVKTRATIKNSGKIIFDNDDITGKVLIDLSVVGTKTIALREQERISEYDSGVFTSKKSLILASEDYGGKEYDITPWITNIHNQLSS